MYKIVDKLANIFLTIIPTVYNQFTLVKTSKLNNIVIAN